MTSTALSANATVSSAMPRGQRFLDEVLAVEQDHAVGPAPARDVAKARDEGIRSGWRCGAR